MQNSIEQLSTQKINAFSIWFVLASTTNLRSATFCFGRGQKCFSFSEKEMKIRRASFHFLDHDIQKTLKGTRFCMETSSHKNEIQRHTETEPDFILVKNVHESFTDNRKTNKNVTLQKRSLLCVA